MNKTRTIGIIILAAALVVALLSGCSQQEAEAAAAAPATSGETQPVAPAENPGGLDTTSNLALGTLKLEGTENAVTQSQAAEMLPLWQVIAGGSLKSAAETGAVIKQIESKLTDAQVAAIGAMGLTQQDVNDWMAEQGIEVRAPAEGQAGEGPGVLQNMSEEDRAKMREELQNMSEEDRATRMAEMGVQRPEGAEGGSGAEGRPGGSFGRGSMLLGPLVELLTARAAG